MSNFGLALSRFQRCKPFCANDGHPRMSPEGPGCVADSGPIRRMPIDVRLAKARTILSRTSGFIAAAGFTHSLTPARNCLFGCTYCYVPTLRVRAGLKREDWQRWGRHTTHKQNSAELLKREIRAGQVIYCSPLVDPYQPSEGSVRAMPGILRTLCEDPPAVFVLQTRGALILRDLGLLQELGRRTALRVSFSLTTDREDVRRMYEPHCDSIDERLRAIRQMADLGIPVHCTLAPILPCQPERLAELVLDCSRESVIADPLHTRGGKPHGAVTRPEALRVSRVRGFEEWHDTAYQHSIVDKLGNLFRSSGRAFGVGVEGFRMLAA